MEVEARGSLIERMVGAATLDIDTYEEVEHDESATSQAAIVVAIVAVAAAIGGVDAGTGGLIAGLISAFAGWLIWSAMTYLIGTSLFAGKATWGELLRTLGFAQSPGVLYVLGIIPILGVFVKYGVWIWLLVAGIVAIRQALDVDTGKAILTALIGWGIYVIFAIIMGVILGLGSRIAGG
jgi:hypothetical protein